MNISEKIFSLRKKLHDHNYRYYVLDDPLISDYDFDMMLKELERLEKENPEYFDVNSPTQRVGGSVTKSIITSVHSTPMYSLDNSYSLEDLKEWEKRIKKIKRMISKKKLKKLVRLRRLKKRKKMMMRKRMK